MLPEPKGRPRLPAVVVDGEKVVCGEDEEDETIDAIIKSSRSSSSESRISP